MSRVATMTSSRNKRNTSRPRQENLHYPFSFVSVSSSGNTPSSSCSHSQSTTSPSIEPTMSPHHDHVEVDISLQNEGHKQTDLNLLQSWQEEAHWMSFRCAVQDFASSKKLCLHSEDDCSWEEEAIADLFPIVPKKQQSAKGWNEDAASSSSSASYESALAETRMRLALAQAERDELEFALMQQKQR